MNAMRTPIKTALGISFAGIGFLASFYTVIDVMFFLSKLNYNESATEKAPEEVKWTWALIINSMLLSLFALQHTVFATKPFKDMFAKCNLMYMQRSVYVMLTCIALEVTIRNWQYTQSIKAWEFSIENRSIACFYYLVHVLSWLLIYIGSICMDINELLGVKQVYYALQQLPDPLTYKSPELKQLYTHMRHPSFIGFVIIFWCVPVMRLDRIYLASFLTLYMYIAWRTDSNDLKYQRYQVNRKFY